MGAVVPFFFGRSITPCQLFCYSCSINETGWFDTNIHILSAHRIYLHLFILNNENLNLHIGNFFLHLRKLINSFAIDILDV